MCPSRNRSVRTFLVLALTLLCCTTATAGPLWVTGDRVNLRQGPQRQAPVIARLLRGTEVAGLRQEGEWWQVRAGDRQGFLHGSLVKPLHKWLVSGDRVNLRAAASTTAPSLAQLSRKTPVDLEECRDQWCRVTVLASGRRGWVHRSLLQPTSPPAPGDGYGRRVMADGTVYEGEFKNGLFHGQGTLTFPDGRRYQGSFVQGRIEGYGTMTMGAGSYQGEWKNGQFHGQGTLRRFDGSRLQGRWEHNRWTGEGKILPPEDR